MSVDHCRYVVRYSGRVQGVWFRKTALGLAAGLSIGGFVKNEQDGSVLLDVQGPENDLQELMRRISSSFESNIESVQVEERKATGKTSGFRIKY